MSKHTDSSENKPEKISGDSRKRKILVVAPGALYSTFDTYTNYLDAFDCQVATTAVGFAYHYVLEYHTVAREAMQERYGSGFEEDATIDIIRASRELLIEIYLHKPDYVFVIDGSKFPPNLFRLIRQFRKDTGAKFVLSCYVTEAPYINDVTDDYASFFDVIFTNDKYDAVRRMEKTGKNNVAYLPHSYDLFRHYSNEDNAPKKYDVFFCGTLFPERAKLLSQVDWTGINAVFYGTSVLADQADVEALKAAGVFTEKTLDNDLVAKYYRESKIVISPNRTFGWDKTYEELEIDAGDAYSVGPRVIEAAACGAFVLSEYRPELKDIFGDSVPIFKSAKELEELVRYYLANESERVNLSAQSHKAVLEMSYDNRATFVLSTLETARQQLYNGGTNV